jgi:hypothetical protein
MTDFEARKKRAAEQYASLTDDELTQLAAEAWSLTEVGKEALRPELNRRGLQVALAAAPPPKVPPPNLVTIRRFRDNSEALLAQTALESGGIESFLIDETTIRMDWLWSDALGGVKLCVGPDDRDGALALLNQSIPERFNVDGLGEYEQPHCPQCGSLDISYQGLDKRVAYMGILFLNLPIILKENRWKCQACGSQWKPVDEPDPSSSG